MRIYVNRADDPAARGIMMLGPSGSNLRDGVHSNPDEDMLMSTSEYQDKLVDGIVNGILEYSKVD